MKQLTIKPPVLVNPFELLHPLSTSQQQASTPKRETPPPMDPPPLPNAPAAIASTVSATSVHLSYPESVESSPRSRHENTHDDPLPAVPGARLRLMCSFGGHIMPRPHDKSLCYVGGETRLVAVDRQCSLSAFCTRLSRALLNGRPFTLKYQLPNEDLDSLVSVATDEDLENMIEEYDRLTASSASSVTSSRIRLFLFFNKPDTVASMGPLLNDAKSETWFVDALNGSGLIPRGDSDSAAMDTLLNLDGEFEGQDGADEQNKQAKSNNAVLHEVQYPLPDSPMVEKTSSFGSSSSSPSMSNLPPIRVRVDQDGGTKLQEQRGGIEDQFGQISLATTNIHKQDDVYGGAALSALPPHPATIATAPMITPAGGSSDNLNRILSDDERSDHGVPVGFRKPPLPLQPVQQKACGAYNLPSPDSVASDSSIASANSLSKNMYYQDQVHLASRDTRAAVSPNMNADTCIPSPQIQIQQVQDSYALAPQLDQQPQQQFMQTNMHYIPHPAAAPAPVAMSSYYPVYAHQPSQQQQQQLHHPADHQQYSAVYMMPVTQVTQPQPYMSMQSNTGVMTMKSNVTDASIVAPSRPLTPASPSIVAASTAYKEVVPPIYPTNTATLAKPEMAATVYRTAVPSTTQVVQVQQPYVGFSQMQNPPQSVAVTPGAATNYGYEYPNTTQDQMYYAQHQAPPLPPQYQTMTQAAAAAALADASKQLPTQ